MAETGGIALEISTILSAGGDLAAQLTTISDAFGALEIKSNALIESVGLISGAIGRTGVGFETAAAQATVLDEAILNVLKVAEQAGKGITEVLTASFDAAIPGITVFKDSVLGIEGAYKALETDTAVRVKTITEQWSAAAASIEASFKRIQAAPAAVSAAGVGAGAASGGGGGQEPPTTRPRSAGEEPTPRRTGLTPGQEGFAGGLATSPAARKAGNLDIGIGDLIGAFIIKDVVENASKAQEAIGTILTNTRNADKIDAKGKYDPEYERMIRDAGRETAQGTIVSNSKTLEYIATLAKVAREDDPNASSREVLQHVLQMAPEAIRAAEVGSRIQGGSVDQNIQAFSTISHLFGAWTAEKAKPIYDEVFKNAEADEIPISQFKTQLTRGGVGMARTAMGEGPGTDQRVIRDIGSAYGSLNMQTAASYQGYWTQILEAEQHAGKHKGHATSQNLRRLLSKPQLTKQDADDIEERMSKGELGEDVNPWIKLGLLDEKGKWKPQFKDSAGHFNEDAINKQLAQDRATMPDYAQMELLAFKNQGGRYADVVSRPDAEAKRESYNKGLDSKLRTEQEQERLIQQPIGQWLLLQKNLSDISNSIATGALPRLNELLRGLNQVFGAISKISNSGPVGEAAVNLASDVIFGAILAAVIQKAGKFLGFDVKAAVSGLMGVGAKAAPSAEGAAAAVKPSVTPSSAAAAAAETAAPAAAEASVAAKVAPTLVEDASKFSGALKVLGTLGKIAGVFGEAFMLYDATKHVIVGDGQGDYRPAGDGKNEVRNLDSGLMGGYRMLRDWIVEGKNPDDNAVRPITPPAGTVVNPAATATPNVTTPAVPTANLDNSAALLMEAARALINAANALHPGASGASGVGSVPSIGGAPSVVPSNGASPTSGSVPTSPSMGVTPSTSTPSVPSAPSTPIPLLDPSSMGVPFSANTPASSGAVRLASLDTGTMSDAGSGLIPEQPDMPLSSAPDTDFGDFLVEQQKQRDNASVPTSAAVPSRSVMMRQSAPSAVTGNLNLNSPNLLGDYQTNQLRTAGIPTSPSNDLLGDHENKRIRNQEVSNLITKYGNGSPLRPVTPGQHIIQPVHGHAGVGSVNTNYEGGPEGASMPSFQNRHIIPHGTGSHSRSAHPGLGGTAHSFGGRTRQQQHAPSASGAAEVPGSLQNAAGKNFAQKSPQIMAALMKDLNITKVQAAGIMGNLGHESAGLTTMQEKNPVGGGRGGLGWAQWTGPRRVEYEKWSKDHNLSTSSDAANYGFLVHELQTTEKNSLAQLRKETTVSGATQSYEKYNERAGVVNMGSRDTWASRAMGAYDKQEPQVASTNTPSPGQTAIPSTPGPTQARVPGPMAMDPESKDFGRYGYTTSQAQQSQNHTHNINTHLDGDLIAQNTVKSIVKNLNGANRGVSGFDSAQTPSQPGPVVRHA